MNDTQPAVAPGGEGGNLADDVTSAVTRLDAAKLTPAEIESLLYYLCGSDPDAVLRGVAFIERKRQGGAR